MNKQDYEAFKKDYLAKFSPHVLEQWEALESIETWRFDNQIEAIARVFNKLPRLFAYPINQKNREIIGELIVLIAYLPFRDSIISLAWCGFNNEQWGSAIYEVSYSFYNDGLGNTDVANQPEYIAAKTIVLRIDTVCKISHLQQVTGSQL